VTGFRSELARALLRPGAEQRKVAFAFLERTAAMLDLDSRELAHRLEAQLDTGISRAEPALIAPAATTLNSDSVNRDITDVVKELEARVGRDFGRPHWYDEERDIIG
jgi:hypothetical protein